MRNLRRLLFTPMLVVLLGMLSACIIEARPDRSMLIYVPPPVIQKPASLDLTLTAGTIPQEVASPLLDLVSAAAAPVNTTTTTTALTTTASTTLTGTGSITGTDALTATILGLSLDRATEVKTLRAFGKLLWIQNDLITRHYQQ